MPKLKTKRSATIVGLIMSLFGIQFFAKIFQANSIFQDSYTKQILFSDYKKWFLVILLSFLIFFWENKNLNSVGVKKTNTKTIIQALGLALSAVIISLLILGLAINIFNIQQPSTLSQVSSLSLLVKLLTITTAAITEEFLYRGYAIERIYNLTGNLKLGGLISAFIFLAIHFPAWGIAGAIPQFVFAVFLTTFYIYKRNLIACIVMHWLINFTMIIILPSFI